MIDITGRDGFIILEALATALVSLEQLPEDLQPKSNMDDMRRMLELYPPAAVDEAWQSALRRLKRHQNHGEAGDFSYLIDDPVFWGLLEKRLSGGKDAAHDAKVIQSLCDTLRIPKKLVLAQLKYMHPPTGR
jgi:hypothetical protein